MYATGLPLTTGNATDVDLTRRMQETHLLCAILGALNADVLAFPPHEDIGRLRLGIIRRLAELAGVDVGDAPTE